MDVVEVQQTPAAPVITSESTIVERDMVTTGAEPAEPSPGPVFVEVDDAGQPAPAAAPAPERVEQRRQTIADLKDRAAAMREAAQAEATTRAAEAAKVQAEQAQARAAAERKAQIDSYLDNPEASAKEFGCAVWEVRFELSKRLGLDEATARKLHDYAAERELDQTVASTSLGRELQALKQKLEGDAAAAEEQRRVHSWRAAQRLAMPEVAKLSHLSAHVAKEAKASGESPDDVVARLIVEAVAGLKTSDPRAFRRVERGEYSDAEVLAAINASLAPTPPKAKPARTTTPAKPAEPLPVSERERERQENKRIAADLVAKGALKFTGDDSDEGETLEDLNANPKWQDGLSEQVINKRLAAAWRRSSAKK